MLLQALLWGVLLPLAASTVALLGAARFPGLRTAAGVLSLSAGYCAGHLGLRGWPPFPGRERLDWLFYLALAGTALGIWQTARPAAARRWHWLGAGFCLLSAWLLLQPRLAEVSGPAAIAWVAALAAAMSAWWLSLDMLTRRVAPSVWLPPVGVALAGSGLVTLLSGTAAVAQVQGIVAVALLPHGWATFRGEPIAPALRSDVWLLAILLPGTWAVGYFYADVPAWAVVPLCLTALTGWIVRAPGIRNCTLGRQVAIATAAALLVAVMPVGMTLFAFINTAPDPYDYGAAASSPPQAIFPTGGRRWFAGAGPGLTSGHGVSAHAAPSKSLELRAHRHRPARRRAVAAPVRSVAAGIGDARRHGLADVPGSLAAARALASR